MATITNLNTPVPDQSRQPFTQPVEAGKGALIDQTWFRWLLQMWSSTNVIVANVVTHTGDLLLNHLVLGNGGSDIKTVTALDGQVPIGATSDGAVQLATLTAGTGVTITSGTHSITIATTGFGSLIPLVTGAEPPVLVSDGDGHLILVPAA